MISLSSQLTPSELLCCAELPSFIDELLRSSCALRREGRLLEAERCALDAIGPSQETGANVGQAVALIHLADVHRAMGKLGPALANCQQAYRIFQRQPSRYQRHNEAVAAYALGLIHQLLGNEMDALKWYQESDRLFRRVKDDWSAVNALAQMETCIRAQRWMEALSKHLTAARTRTDVHPGACIWMPIILPDAEGGRVAIAELEIDKYIVGRQITVNGESFRVQALKGNQCTSLEPGVECYVLGIPDAARAPLDASEGDYALVVRRQEASKEGPGVMETLGRPEFGNFERDDEGNINFILPDATVIGSEDIGRVGYVAALLKRA
jgi:tetratricopeptide (TPR) repeat protein